MNRHFGYILFGIFAASLASAGCSDDDNTDIGQQEQEEDNINHQEKWIGAPCTCEGEGCELLGVPVPVPAEGSKIVGCENIDITGIEGGKLVCLRTIPADLSAVAPTVYAPKGYCTISSVKAEMDNAAFVEMTNYGDADKMAACPKGSALIKSYFDYSIMATPAKITNKTCAKLCNTDADCNTDGKMTCLNKKGVKFCYNEENLKIAPDFTVTAF